MTNRETKIHTIILRNRMQVSKYTGDICLGAEMCVI